MIVAISDLHGNLPETPACDVLILGGDLCPDDPDVIQLDWLHGPFRDWLTHQPAKKVIGIAGNHDFVFQTRPTAVASLQLPWTYLLDESFEHEGLRYYGMPWIPNLSRWAFYLDEGPLRVKYEAVPKKTDIVISHGPPLGYCDQTCAMFGNTAAGAHAAGDMLRRVKPKALICGHIHEAFGKMEHPSGASIFNVSYVDETYTPMHRFVVIDV